MAPDIERKLAAILSADVVGYSRLMAEDEDATVRTVEAYREQIELHVRQHRGRMQFTGDNFLAEFGSAVEAVRCATEILAAGFDGYQAKPISVRDLLAEVRRLLAREGGCDP